GSGENQDAMTGMKNVPTFYSGAAYSEDDLFLSGYIALAIGVVFGAIHLIAWSYSFLSHAEQLLWRLSSIAIIGIPAVALAW
ncbi:5905_t:CDS:1, partial [Acaulospora colombiana]